MWACYIGKISEPYLRKWEPQRISPDQKEPDVFDVLSDRTEVGYRLDPAVILKCFGNSIQVDWGGYAYKVTREQLEKYNQICSPIYRLRHIEDLEPDHVYGLIDVEIY